ncbi:MAG: hypothetical protein GOMPHAMPRED_003807 [Gomphillus americanus]|uniref:Hydrophobic surface binding protein n=1 Tax=Gomphillus americanus TaxID=1940652 RepID=A0A8H3IRU6_9LECA|nr:MAG: hypothetical protein GOMPHAMPRED_003807 [Gomphillus americanus]
MVAIKDILLLAASATAAVIPRNAATIEKDLKTINTDISNLHTAVNNYNGGGAINALPIQNDEQTLDKAINSADTDAKNSGAVNDADSKTIIAYIKNTLEPNIAATLKALIAKKADFAKDGLTSTVLSDLQTLKKDTDTFGADLLKKTPSGQQSAGKAALAKIDADFNNAIKQF